MTRPVLPGDEASEYLITHAVVDYLSSRAKPPIGGIRSDVPGPPSL
jgi:hypothetical protein